jgi:hypothetical protein
MLQHENPLIELAEILLYKTITQKRTLYTTVLLVAKLGVY